jgi:ABC-type lipoprotein release transport system permease subunit
MIQLFKLAFRNLMRNRRRSILSALAVSMGLALLLLIASVVEGEMQGSINSTIRLVSGHLQVRSATYVDAKSSLKWEDLVANPDQLAAQIQALPQVSVVTPRLFATGIATVGNQSIGVQIIGIDPSSAANAPFVQGMTSGQFLPADDREGILVGQPLTDKLKVKVGDQVNLLANTSNGDVVEQAFTIRGVFSTHTPTYDLGSILMPLAKAQAMTQTQNHASALFVLLRDVNQTDAVAAALKGADFQVKTWQDMNQLVLQTEDLANAYMFIIYLIVLAVTATVIVNTLIMAVFERTREIGILAAIGMKGRRIMALFLAEASLLAVAGIAFGVLLGWLMCLYFGKFGILIGNVGTTGMLLGDRIYAILTAGDTINLTIIALVITLVASLYPAILAARLEPVEALHGK